jgi:hypothetical protein
MNIQTATNGVHNPDNFAIVLLSHGIPPVLGFCQKCLTGGYRDSSFIATVSFSSFVVPSQGKGVSLKGASFRAVSGHRKDTYAKNLVKNHKIAYERHQRKDLRYISILSANIYGGFAIGSDAMRFKEKWTIL